MSDKGQIATLLRETDNAKAWFEKLSKDLEADPSNETIRRLLFLTKELYERRVQLLSNLGVVANDQ
jgi:hypothetical protein